MDKLSSRRKLPKGDRLNWKSLDDARKDRLSSVVVKSRLVTGQELKDMQSGNPKVVLVP